jgi:hypothetical protein
MFYDMHNCFKQINTKIEFNDTLTDIKSDLHMTHDKWQKYGLTLKKKENYEASIATTYEVTDQVKSYVLSTIPTELLQLETPQVWYLEVTGTTASTTMLPPHIDTFRICTINFYINTNGEKTKFYEYKSGTTMDEIGEFCAKNDECFILNTTVPHSVKLMPEKTRSVIGASFLNTPYEKVITYFS